jgi:UMF1 family MFS transporter
MEQKNNSKKKNLLSWLLYDAANTFIDTPLGAMFLAQWIVIDKGVDDIWYGATFSIASVLVLLTSPILGAWSDKIGQRLPFLKNLTFGLYIFLGLLAFLIPINFPLRIFTVLFLAVIIQYIYQLSLIFYNSLLVQISSSKNRGKISGLGEMIGNSGFFLAMLVLLPFSNKNFSFYGEPGRAQVFIPAFILFFILTLPMLLWFKEKNINKIDKQKDNLSKVNKLTLSGIKELLGKNKNVSYFLISFSLISDGLLTISIYYAIIFSTLYKISDNQKSIILLLMIVFNIIGAYVLGKISDKIGAKKIFFLSSISVMLILVAAFLSSEIFVLYLLAFVGGLGRGGIYSSARALLVKISPPEHLGEYFGFYSTFQRFASITGPLLWGGITLTLKYSGDIKYRIAGLALISIMFAGTMLLLKVKELKVVT